MTFLARIGKSSFGRNAVEVSTEVVANHALVSVQEFGQVQSQVVLESATRDLLAYRQREADFEGNFYFCLILSFLIFSVS